MAHNKRRFTDQMLERLRPPTAGRREITDAVAPGLILRVTQKGAKTFAVIFKIPGEGGVNSMGRPLTGRQHRVTLGRWPAVTLNRARERAVAIAGAATQGVDSRVEITQKFPVATVATAAKQYIESYVRPNLATGPKVEALFRMYINPLLGTKPLAEVTRGDVHAAIDKFVQEGRIGLAREVRKYLRALFNWALERDLMSANPASNLSRRELAYPDDDGRALTDDELRAVWTAADRMGYAYGPMYKLLLLTGQRTGDWARASWTEINEQDRVLEIPAARYKTRRPHTVPLVEPVWEILQSLPRWAAGNYLFTGRAKSGETPLNGYNSAGPRLKALALEALREQRGDPEASLPHFDVKDLRKTCRTRLTKLGVSEEIAERVIGHTPTKIVRTYNRHDYLTEKREALAEYAGHIRGIIF